MPADHPDYAAFLTQLATMLHGRFERTEDSADLDGAIRAAYEAVDATQDGDIERANALVNLGVAMRSRFRLTGLPGDRDAALDALRKALQVTGARPSVRARASVGAGLLASHDPAQAARLLEDAVRLLSEIAPRQLARGDQQHAVGVFAGVASAAASAALADPAVPAQERPARLSHCLRLAGPSCSARHSTPATISPTCGWTATRISPTGSSPHATSWTGLSRGPP